MRFWTLASVAALASLAPSPLLALETSKKCTAQLSLSNMEELPPLIAPIGPGNPNFPGYRLNPNVREVPPDPKQTRWAIFGDGPPYGDQCNGSVFCLTGWEMQWERTKIPLDCSKPAGQVLHFPALHAELPMPRPYIGPRHAAEDARIPMEPDAKWTNQTMSWTATKGIDYRLPTRCVPFTFKLKEGSSTNKIPGWFQLPVGSWTLNWGSIKYYYSMPVVHTQVDLDPSRIVVKTECEERKARLDYILDVDGQVQAPFCGGAWNYLIQISGDLSIDGWDQVQGTLFYTFEQSTTGNIKIRFPTQAISVGVSGSLGHDPARGQYLDLNFNPMGASQLSVTLKCLGIPFRAGAPATAATMMKKIAGYEDKDPQSGGVRIWLSEPVRTLDERTVGASKTKLTRILTLE